VNSDKQDGSLDSVDNGIQRKRSYFWGLIGDWTLQPKNEIIKKKEFS
jgi:hypothetical protein